MALTSLETLTAIAPEVAARADYATFLTLAAQRLAGSSVWGAVYTQAVCLLAAHLATLAPASAAAAAAAATVAGPITSDRAGDLARTYGTVSTSSMTATDAELARTSYGLSFLALRNSRSARAPLLIRART